VTGPLAVVAGAVANKPFNGGEVWVRMSWLRGLSRLGWRVAFVEEIAATACVDAEGRTAPAASSVNRRWFDEVMREFRLGDASSLCCAGEPVAGLCSRDLHDLLHEADLLVNISGNLSSPSLRDACEHRVYLDIDPGFTQFWAARGFDRGRLDDHHVHVTIGANVGSGTCPIPTDGIDWQHVRPPVVLEDWPAAARDPRSGTGGEIRFTTIGTWRGPFGPVEVEGASLGSKVHEFRRFVALPSTVGRRFDAALAIHTDETDDLALLAEHGWNLLDPREVAGTPAAFREFVRGSSAEFSVAQELYVATRSGWFSDRSTRYLAAGRPVLVQDTGFSSVLPTGKGLVSFTTLDEAIAGAESILADYESHASAARRVAEEHFDSDRVLSEFLERWGPT
jgi:hypothetical protein